jgi:hypothetical protein
MLYLSIFEISALSTIRSPLSFVWKFGQLHVLITYSRNHWSHFPTRCMCHLLVPCKQNSWHRDSSSAVGKEVSSTATKKFWFISDGLLATVMVACVWTGLKYCFDVCRAVRCAHNALHNPHLLTYILLYCEQNFLC